MEAINSPVSGCSLLRVLDGRGVFFGKKRINSAAEGSCQDAPLPCQSKG